MVVGAEEVRLHIGLGDDEILMVILVSNIGLGDDEIPLKDLKNGIAGRIVTDQLRLDLEKIDWGAGSVQLDMIVVEQVEAKLGEIGPAENFVVNQLKLVPLKMKDLKMGIIPESNVTDQLCRDFAKIDLGFGTIHFDMMGVELVDNKAKLGEIAGPAENFVEDQLKLLGLEKNGLIVEEVPIGS